MRYNQFRSAGVAHLVERDLAKVEVASSSLVARSKKYWTPFGCPVFFYAAARLEQAGPGISRDGNSPVDCCQGRVRVGGDSRRASRGARRYDDRPFGVFLFLEIEGDEARKARSPRSGDADSPVDCRQGRVRVGGDSRRASLVARRHDNRPFGVSLFLEIEGGEVICRGRHPWRPGATLEMKRRRWLRKVTILSVGAGLCSA